LPHRKFGLHRTVDHVRRYRHIMAVLMKYGIAEVGGSVTARLRAALHRGIKPADAHAGLTRPLRLRMAMEELGPTFIKLGQLLSTRPDLLAPEYIEQLEMLQDHVPPVAFPLIQAEVESQLGGRIEDVFTSFDPHPLAAGSIAQVHRAVIRDGRQAVVKVRRPGIVRALRIECEMLEDLSGFIKTAFFGESPLDPQRMVREFTEAVMREVDLSAERRNQERFAASFAGVEGVRIPAVYREYCSQGVLTMEYVGGIKPSNQAALDAGGYDRGLLARRGADFVLRQIFDIGFFHADPHPGNFFMLPGNVVAAMDFGQVARLTAEDRLVLQEMVLCIVDRDAVRLIRTLQRNQLLGDETNVPELTRDAEEVLDRYWNLSISDIPFRQLLTEVFELIRRHGIRPPAEFTLMLKSLMTIESFAKGLDPGFEIVENLKPYAARFRRQRLDPRRMLREARGSLADLHELAFRMPEDFNAILTKLRQGQIQMRVHHEHLENLVKTLDKSSNRISFALIIAALLVGSSLLVPQQGSLFGLLHMQALGVLGFTAAAIMGIWLLLSIMQSRKL
jgi:ubiquinone biosynthesis protein